MGSAVYGLYVRTHTYLILGPTQSAVLEGSVQGVVVQARNTGLPQPVISGFGSRMSNCAVAVVSFTSR